MRILVTVLTTKGNWVDVVVTSDATASISQLLPALRHALPDIASPGSGEDEDATLWVDGHLVTGITPLGQALREGVVVALDNGTLGALFGLIEPRGVVEIRVSGGPGAGSTHRLSLGTATVGSGVECTIAISDPRLAAHVATLKVFPTTATGVSSARTTVHGAPGTTLRLDGAPLSDEGEEMVWAPGSVLEAGDTVLTLHTVEQADAALLPTGEGKLNYNRPPRLLSRRQPCQFEVPREPIPGEKPRLPLMAAIIPLGVAVVAALVLRQPIFLLFAILSPILLFSNFFGEKRLQNKNYRKACQEYLKIQLNFRTELNAARAWDEIERRTQAPDPATILLTATGPRRRLWERRRDDPDALLLRVGLSDRPAAVELNLLPGAATLLGKGRGLGSAAAEPPLARNVPVTFPLVDMGVLGIAGVPDCCRRLAWWLVGQTAVLHSPSDLSLVVLTTASNAHRAWNWVHWLPHTTPGQGQDCHALLGVDAETVPRRVQELLGEISRRRQTCQLLTVDTAGLHRFPSVLVVLDGAAALRNVPGVTRLLREGPAVGIYALCLDESERLLPEECQAVASWVAGSESRLWLRGNGLVDSGEVLADQVSMAWCERLARALAPIQDRSDDSMLPRASRLLELLGMPDPTPQAILDIWALNGRATRIPLGSTASGAFHLDLSQDGPHILVAGTTGSGKSELLRTLIASLATANHPDAMTFLLVDYKGGSAFADCATLPHTVGMTTDLDAYLTRRALSSLSAELTRRERLLAQASVKDIDDYWSARQRHIELPALPRLMLVIDELAALTAELPDFVPGLVSIAQRGRSLGMHLILATQRPAGVVSADIRANTNARIALRVVDAGESRNVVDISEAAAIPTAIPGRCYVQVGTTPPTAMQTACIGGRRPNRPRGEVTVTRLAWHELARSPAQPEDEDRYAVETDLSVLVNAIEGATDQLGLTTQRSPWLPPLPAQVTLSDLSSVTGETVTAEPIILEKGDEVTPVAFGLLDVPAQQSRQPLVLDLTRDSHLLVAGAPRTGRSTALRTLAGAIATQVSPVDVHLYGMDCGSGALLPLTALRQCGAVVTRDQSDRIERLFDRLLAEITRRQRLLAAGGWSSLAEQRVAAAPGARLPWLVLLLDGWEGLIAAFEGYGIGRLVALALRLLREGPAAGLRAVITSDRSGLIGPLAAVVDDRLVLRLADPGDWALAGVLSRDVPEELPPGRGLLVNGTGVLEAQVALLDADPSGAAQVKALRRLGQQASKTYGRLPRSQRPLRVDALPSRITTAQARQLDPTFRPSSTLWALVGAGCDELRPVGVDLLGHPPGFLIAGPARSGRSTALVTMADSLLAHGAAVILVTPRRSPLRELGDIAGALGVLNGEEKPEELIQLTSGRQRFAVLIDDAELLTDAPLAPALDQLAQTTRDGDHALVVSGAAADLAATYRGFAVTARRSGCGLLLGGQLSPANDLFGIRLPPSSASGPAGRGLLIQGNTVTAVQVAVSG